MASIFLVDLPIVFRRHAHVTEEVSDALRRTVSDVRRWAERADHIACAVDTPPYLRAELYPEYKAGRREAPSWMPELLAKTVERLRNDGVPVLGARGFEADDVIATLATALRGEHKITIVSGDKDALQLVGENVRVMQPASGEFLRRDEVIAKLGVEPSQVVDYLALIGDTADNVPGVPGVGEKTAAEWLGRWGDIDGLLAGAEDIPDKHKSKRESLAEHRSQLLTARQLIRLRTDAPVDVAEVFARRQPQAPPVESLPEPDVEPAATERTAEPVRAEARAVQVPRRSLQIIGGHGGGIKGIRPSLAEAGKIKIGGLGEKRTSKGGKEFRLPVKLDHFVITKTTRDDDGDLDLDHELMAELPKSPDGKIREIPIVVHSDEIDEVFPTAYALYYGRRLSCRGDGETATRWEMDKSGNRTGRSTQRRCPCDYLDSRRGVMCKPHGTLHCSISVPGRAVAGSVHRWRTTSLISISRMIGSLMQIKETCGTMRGLPLVLRVEPVRVQPPGEAASTVYCCHVELRAENLLAVQRQALQLAQMRRVVAGEDVSAYRALIQPPATGESEEEEAEIAAEFYHDQHLIDEGAAQ